MSKQMIIPESIKAPESDYGGTIVHKIPIPDPSKLNPKELSDALKSLTPLKIEQEFKQIYHHSHGQDTPFFAGLSNGVLLATYCPNCHRVYVTPRGNCIYDGKETGWVQMKGPGKLHTYTICYSAGEEFQDQTPFPLIYVEFENIKLPDGKVAKKTENVILSRLVLPKNVIEQIKKAPETKDYSIIKEVFKIGMPVFPKFKRITEQKISDLYFVRGVSLEEKVKE